MSGSPYATENLETLRTVESERLLSNAVEVRRRLYASAESAEAVGDFKGASHAYAIILRSLEMVGKLLDQFKGHERTVINQLTISPDYIKLRAALINALRPYPEARVAVAAVLRDIESVDVTGDTKSLPRSRVAYEQSNGSGT